MDNIRNCKECGKIFKSVGLGKICPVCQRKDEKNFKAVKEYVYDNPGATMLDIIEETGVTEEKVLRYLREGRLEISTDDSSLSFLECERCGKGIRTGRFCESCSNAIERELKGAISREPGFKKGRGEKNKMHIAEIRKRNR